MCLIVNLVPRCHHCGMFGPFSKNRTIHYALHKRITIVGQGSCDKEHAVSLPLYLIIKSLFCLRNFTVLVKFDI